VLEKEGQMQGGAKRFLFSQDTTKAIKRPLILQGDAGGVILGHALTPCSKDTMSPVQKIP